MVEEFIPTVKSIIFRGKEKSGEFFTFRIIDMADRSKDTEDKILEYLFQSEPVHDAGFSTRTMTQLRRKLWVRRLALPIAFLLGALIAVKPLSQLMVTFIKFMMSLTGSLQGLSVGYTLQLSTIMTGVLLMLGVFMVGKVFEKI